MEARRRSPNLVGPLILISIGVIFLLNNLGYVNWDIWITLARLWPLLLIIAGLDLLIGRRSLLGSVIVALLFIALFAGVLFYLGSPAAVATGQALTSQAISQPLQGAARAQIEINPAAASLTLSSLGDSTDLVQGTVASGRGESVTQDFRIDGGTAVWSLKTGGISMFPLVDPSVTRRGWNLKLNPKVPLDLRINVGVGEADLDLIGLTLTRLDVDAAVGQAVVALPATGRFQGRLNAAIGSLRVKVPDGLAVRIHVTSGLGSTSISPALQKQGDLFISPGYDTAENRAELDANAAIGSISITK